MVTTILLQQTGIGLQSRFFVGILFPPSDWDMHITRSVGGAPVSLCVEDVNYDGKKDLVTANKDDHTISVLCWNQTSQDWDGKITQVVGNSPYGVSVGDANNDEQNDIVTADNRDDTVSILCWTTFPLEPPELNSISPSNDNDGIINLSWNEVNEAEKYYIFRNQSTINSMENLSSIALTLEHNYTDILLTSGVYFYVIVARNTLLNSSISNCESVLVNIGNNNSQVGNNNVGSKDRNVAENPPIVVVSLIGLMSIIGGSVLVVFLKKRIKIINKKMA